MAPHEADELKKRVGRKLTKRITRLPPQITLEMPDSLKDGDDVDEDVTRPKGHKNLTMNQSIFGMIAAAGSQVDCNSRFEGPQDDEGGDEDDVSQDVKTLSLDDAGTSQSQSTLPPTTKHRRKFSDNKLLRSLQPSNLRLSSSPSAKSNKSVVEKTTSTEKEVPKTPKIEVESVDSPLTSPKRQQPIMSQMLEARAELAQRPSFEMLRTKSDEDGGANKKEDNASDLANRLKEIFEFNEAEEVISGMRRLLSSSTLDARFTADFGRISVLAHEECFAARFHVCHDKACLLLCVPTQKFGRLPHGVRAI